jgi:hypothetical protein
LAGSYDDKYKFRARLFVTAAANLAADNIYSIALLGDVGGGDF